MDSPGEIRAVIVDDEPLAREGIRMLLADDPEVAIAAESGDGPSALETIRRLRPDLVFLDVQMPEMNGFEVMASLPPGELPAVIFVTAFDRYALRAFEVHALDYLLKPFDDDRFHDALRRAKGHLRLSRMSDLSQRLLSLLQSYGDPGAAAAARGRAGPGSEPPAGGADHPRRLAIKDGCRVVFLSVEEIDWIEAADYYVQIHAGGKSYLHRETMNSVEGKLDPARFVRIHRSAIVNRDRIKELRTQGRRDTVVVLAGGAELKVARSHREKLSVLR
ncbi:MULTISPECIES: LytR/AlgR family response regulator transcription factor [unclassified Sorangium]|uniref:LytR/AlgR family response regulator transcription factor n=1 Tax=unclassified Sorangium TaxID=2621164 RepID=UPI003F5FD676